MTEAHEAKPNSETSKRVSAGSLSGESTASEAQAGEGQAKTGMPDSSEWNKVVSK